MTTKVETWKPDFIFQVVHKLYLYHNYIFIKVNSKSIFVKFGYVILEYTHFARTIRFFDCFCF